MAEKDPTDESSGEFSIFLVTLCCKEFTVVMDDTVRELKAKLSAQDSSLIPEMGMLLCNGREMEDNLTMQHYKITPHCFLYETAMLQGGGGHVRVLSLGKVMPGAVRLVELHGAADLEQWSLMTRTGESLRAQASESTEVQSSRERHHPPRLDSGPQGSCLRCMRERFQEVMPEITQDHLKDRNMYRAHLPGAGTFQCSITGLSFKVKSAVTITYRYASWTSHLSKADQETWVPAGPLLHITVQPGVVRAVHLPHFICLAEDVNASLCSIAHFKSGKMTLERPTRLIAYSAVLENPSFSLLGVLWRRLRSTLYLFPMHSWVLIFQQLSAANTTLHLYLIPDDISVKK
ncbi:PREDICTED: NACHT, LRR and PYD domains-containing protein 1-like, partial [Mesitornis unicolor]|uniref:NACHT, LRR and PYD domains-containing protein 1-like n=1 Tax=Mesitornis unicolor TaxID=54374 RepID=UPI000528BA3E